MNVSACAANLLTYFSPEEREIPDNATYPGRNAAVRKALNEALQDLFGKGRPWVRNDSRGAVLNAPATIPITVTQGSTSATIAGGDWQTWMAGCSIVIEGADVDNQIRNASASVVLKYPYSGTTGSHTATVYHDSINLDSDVLEVQDSIKVNGQPIVPASKPLGQNAQPRNIEDFGFRNRMAIYDVPSVTATATPQSYSVETYSPDDVTPPVLRLVFQPAPSVKTFVEYFATLKPPYITDISSTAELPIPFGFVETIFLPIAVKKLRSCPFWRNTSADEEIQAGYQNALAQLAGRDPDKTSGFRFTTSF